MKKGLDFKYYLDELPALRGYISQFVLRKEKLGGIQIFMNQNFEWDRNMNYANI
jgi:hypothetical protein